MDAVENMYRVAGDERYSDTHRDLAARAIARAGREYDMIERTGQAEYYLREARRAGLAEPVYVTVSAHDHGDFRSSQITFQMTTASDVGEWALHFGAELTTTANQASAELETGRRHHDVKVYHMFDEAEIASVPGLAEHTAAAPDSDTQPDPYIDSIAAEHVSEYEPADGAKTMHRHQDGVVVDGPNCMPGELLPQRCLNCGAREGEDCKTWCAYKPEGRPMSLADATAAACDTITKAAQ